VFALREDFLAPLVPYAQQVPTHLRTRFRIDLLTHEAAHEAIVRPASGGRVWSEEAALKVVRDLAVVKLQQTDGGFVERVGPHVEPVQLQVVCHGLWERMPADDLSIDPEDVEAFGDVDRALADYYSTEVRRVAGGRAGEETRLRRWCGERLISADGVRTPVLRAVGASEGLANESIARLVDAHLVRAEQRGGATWYELAHDRLVRPIREDNERWAAATLVPVQMQAALWARQGKPAELLLAEEGLAQAERWEHGLAEPPGEPERSFLAASRAARAQERTLRDAQQQAVRAAEALAATQALAAAQAHAAVRRQRRFTRLLAALGALALATAALAGLQCRAAREQKEIAEQRAAELAFAKAESDERTTQAHDQAHMVAVREAAGDPTLQAVLLREVERPLATRRWLETATDLLQRPIAEVVLAQPSAVKQAAFSPDGRRVLAVLADGTMRVSSADGEGRAVVLFPEQEVVERAVFSPDGERLMSVSRHGVVQLRRADGDGEVVWLNASFDAAATAALSPDGRRVLAVGRDGRVRFRLAEGTDAPAALPHGDVRVAAASYSPDGARIATGASDGALRIWRADGSGEPLRVPLEAGSVVRHVAFAADGSRLLAEGSGWIAVVEVGRAEPTIRRFEGAEGALSPDGTRLVSVRDGATVVTQVDGAGPPVRLGAEGSAPAVFSPDGRWIATATDPEAREGRGGVVWIWRADGAGEPTVLAGHTGAVLAASFAPDGARVLSAAGDELRIWRLDAAAVRVLPSERAAELSAAGDRVATIAGGAVHVWPVDGEPAPVVLGRRGEEEVVTAQFLGDGRRVLTRRQGGGLRAWRADGTGDPVALDVADAHARVSVATDGGRVLAFHDARTVRVCRTDDGAALLAATHPHELVDAELAADGRHVLTTPSGGGGEPWVWAVDRAAEPRSLGRWTSRAWFSPKGDRIVSIGPDAVSVEPSDGSGPPITITRHYQAPGWAEVSPDGRWVLTLLFEEGRVWAASGAGAGAALSHDHTIAVAEFSPDGQWILAASDATARLRRSDASGEELVLRGHTGVITEAEFSADGRRVITSDGSTVLLWASDGTGEPVIMHSAGRPGDAVRATFSADGRRALVATGTVARVWRVLAPEALAPFLWGASRYCLSAARRQDVLGETAVDAARNEGGCRDRTDG
jgi:WD40 repeat protein